MGPGSASQHSAPLVLRCARDARLKLPRHPHVAAMWQRHGDTVAGIFIQLVAQSADRDAENVGRMGAVAEAVFQRLQDEIAFHIGYGAADALRRP